MEQSDSSVVESSRVLVPRQRNDEQQCRCCAGERKENFVLMIITNATDCMGGSDEQGRPVDDRQITEISQFIVNPLMHRQPVQTP